MLYVFEGIDGSGKSSVAKRVAEKLGPGVVQMSFPNYSTPTGVLIKKYLQGLWWVRGRSDNGVDEGISAMAFQALCLANRMEQMPILKAAKGSVNHVVQVRSWHSGWVYGQMDGLKKDWIEQSNSFTDFADVAFLIDTSTEVALQRQKERDDGQAPERYEGKVELLQRASDLYRELWNSSKAQSGRRVVIPGDRPLYETVDLVMMFLRGVRESV